MKTIDDIAQEHYGQEISIVGNGPSLVRMPNHDDYFGRYVQSVRDQKEGKGKDINEYPPPLTIVKRLISHPRKHWTVNGGHSYHPESNLSFLMDDHVYHSDASHPMAGWYDNLIRNTQIPIITSKAYPSYPALVEYPLKEVVKKFRSKRFDETIHCMMALAGYFQVKKVFLLGCDYQPHDRFPGERAGTEYWIGRLEGIGIEVDTSPSQYLMKQSPRDRFFHPVFYGYSFDSQIANDPELLEIVNNIHY